ncbi:MAG TPA: hypothetical protein VD926_00070 [Acidimicrobiales bacterium]|nr:hypothetical protein [Acidimicrobiales bacterium]
MPVVVSVADERGRTELRATPRGLELVWVSPEPLPFVDAAPEFRLAGERLGTATVGRDRRTLTLLLDSDRTIDLPEVEVVLGPRRLDLAGTPAEPVPGGPTGAEPAATALEVDPSAEGTFATTTIDYEADPLPWPEFTRPLETVGHAVLPVGVTDAPLVLFLHGRHQPCYRAPSPSPDDTACPGPDAPVPSELGYDYLQPMLASQGVATVSIAANVINGDDWRSPDGGARARAASVRYHLGLLADWDSTPSNTDWFGRVDLDRVVLVGHSRGGEGVNAAVIETTGADPFTILGQVLIAPVDFSWQTAGYTPTSVFLPSCDGDVFDLQGQRYVDATQTAAPDDPSLRSSVLMIGANHNFFNTEWTPGISQAPSFDDWFDPGDRNCGTSSPRRLSAPEQRQVGKVYVAASVDAFLNGSPAAVNALDRGDVVIPPGVPDARVRTHAIGGRRTTVRPGAGATLNGVAEECASVIGGPVEVDGTQLPGCGFGFSREVHWSPTVSFFGSPEATIVGQLGAIAQWSFDWTGQDQAAGVTPETPLDAGGPGASIDLRVAVDPTRPAPRLAVRLGDGSSTWTSGPFTLQSFPGQAVWAQPVRVPLGEATVDTSSITSVQLVSRSASGHVVVLDTSVRRRGLAPVPDRDLPALRMGEVTTVEGDGPGEGTALVPWQLTGDVSQRSAFGVSIDRSSFDGFQEATLARIDVDAGVTSGTVEVPYEADELDELPFKPQVVVASPLEGMAAADNRGKARIQDDDDPPVMRLTALRSPVDTGTRIGFRLRLSEPRDDFTVGAVEAVVEQGVPQIRTTDVPFEWRRFRISHPDRRRPLSRALEGSFTSFFIETGSLSNDIVVPTIDRPIDVTRSMTISVDGANQATVRLRG